ncbi:hypothetical protein [Kitasatospora sp. NPDC058478]|uniref:hypothetical protein n=1 Tax=unclassified Kitasatospora TaxID=2633591 RepID=UPI003654B575
MSLKDTAGRAAVLQALYEEIGEQLKAAKAEQAAGMKAARQESGTTRIEATLPDGTVVAKVALVAPQPAAEVVDNAAFLEWVRDNRPDQIKREFVTSVREAFVKSLLKELTAAGVPQWVDQETGVVHDVPGVRMQPRAAHTRTTWEAEGPGRVAEAWRSGALAALVLPELTSGGAE